MKIEIDLDNLGFDYDENGDRGRVRTIQEAIVTAAANQIIGASGWEYRNELTAIVREEARTAVAAKLDEALKGNIQRSTEWGEPVGSPASLLDIVRDELGKFLKGTQVRDRFANGQDHPQNLAEMVARTVGAMLRNEFAAEIRTVKSQVVNDLRTKALTAAADALTSAK